MERDDVGDPFILNVSRRVDGVSEPSYVLYWTTDWRSNVPTAVSSDLIHWHRIGDSLPVLPRWAKDSKTRTWGPTVHRVANHWVLYYATEDAKSGRDCIGRGVGASPTGPFKDTSDAPLVCQQDLGGDIDPSVISSTNGTLSLLWKNDGNVVHKPDALWEQALTADGLSLSGNPTRLLVADQTWEHGTVEGPAMLAASRGGWWLFFSGGGWTTGNYNTGVAWCATVAGPCKTPTLKPILVNRPGAISPGGFDTFTAANGTLWASYSTFPNRPANSQQAMSEDRVLILAPLLSH